MKRNGSEKVVVRGFSSVGRALALQARGHRFEPVNLHQAQVGSGKTGRDPLKKGRC